MLHLCPCYPLAQASSMFLIPPKVDCCWGGRLSVIKPQNTIRQNRDISLACYLQQSCLITPPALSILCNGTISCAVRCLFIHPLTPKWQRRGVIVHTHLQPLRRKPQGHMTRSGERDCAHYQINPVLFWISQV